MASIVVRNIDDHLKARLRQQAARHGRSMEAEAREILRRAVEGGQERQEDESLGDLIREFFGPEHGFDFEPYLPQREPMREPPTFE
jgi:plasmid stability protein